MKFDFVYACLLTIWDEDVIDALHSQANRVLWCKKGLDFPITSASEKHSLRQVVACKVVGCHALYLAGRTSPEVEEEAVALFAIFNPPE